MTMTPTIAPSATECHITKRKISPSLPTCSVAAVATTIDCSSTILPITPPALLAAHIRTGLRLSCSAVIRCKLPNNAFVEVSLPVSATPSQPRNVRKNGYSHPVRVNASPNTASIPDYRVTNPSPSMNEIATTANLIRTRVRQKILASSAGLTPSNVPAKRAAMKQAEPVAESQLKSNFAFSGSGFETTGAARVTARCNTGTSHPPRSNAGVVFWLSAVLIDGSPHNNTKTVSTTKGIHARATSAGLREVELSGMERAEDSVSASATPTSCAGSSSKRQMRRGCQKRRKTTVETSDTNPPAMSTRLLSMKFDHTN